MEGHSFELFAMLLRIPVMLCFPLITYFKLKLSFVNLAACRLVVYWSVFQNVIVLERSLTSKVKEGGSLNFTCLPSATFY